MNRRSSVKKMMAVAGTGLLTPQLGFLKHLTPNATKASPSPFYLFTKVLQWLPLEEVPQTVQSLGFDGIDLPVRRNGFFDRDQIKSKLPIIVKESEKLGLRRPVLTTDMNLNHMNEMDEFLRTISGEGVFDYRMGYLPFTTKNIIKELKSLNASMKKLAELHEKHGVTGHYQNHAGTRIGGSVWEIYHLLEGINPKHIGVQFDLRHATVEGYQSYENVFNMISDQITSFDLKDFVWGNLDGKGDKPINVPYGEGNVKFELLQEHPGFMGDIPKILHCEYDLGGAEHGHKNPTVGKEVILSAIAKEVKVYKTTTYK
ncbi:TIM barrel protein [uncultured Cyclobacterium sp.]|uniref:sugar phosphate isomerase/epimerase family protein n=1 Tax=uncultured Cyclobacterium sp. TaxID=453820 RepID=UPI0030EBA551|tara:strand:+ start:49619 stop:50563 length:945 start_codon:yes stop_codon:yes gene_type:complete